MVKGVLTVKNGNQARVNLQPVAPNEFQAGDLGTLLFRVSANQNVAGMTLFSQSARGIAFAKVR